MQGFSTYSGLIPKVIEERLHVHLSMLLSQPLVCLVYAVKWTVSEDSSVFLSTDVYRPVCSSTLV